MKKIMIFIFGILLICSVVTQAQIPQLINFQGRITDKIGKPLTGTYSIRFSLWDSATGGNELWNETQYVNVNNGIFAVLLGSVNPITPDKFSSDNVWLEIKVESDSPMTPRQRIVSVGYAFKAAQADNSTNADKLDGKDSTEFIKKSGDTITGDLAVLGNVGIGIITPSAKLDVNGSIYSSGDIRLGENLTINKNMKVGGFTDLGGNNYGSIFFPYPNASFRAATSGITGTPGLALDLQPGSIFEICQAGVGPKAWVKGNGDIAFGGGRIDNNGAYLHLYQNSNGDALLTTTGKLLIINTHDNGGGGTVHIGTTWNGIDEKCYVKGLFWAKDKRAVAKTENYGERTLYSREGAEIKFIDEGEAQLINGTARVSLEAIFKETIETDSYLVQLTPLGDCNGLYVSERTPDYFVVKELKNGESNVKFMWQISAYRKGKKGVRLEEFTLPALKK
jgi:hypothetical protein